MRRFLVAGNWKMNTTAGEGTALVQALSPTAVSVSSAVDVLVAPPFPYLSSVLQAIGDGPITVAGQNCWKESGGAFTGEVSAEMLLDVGCQSVILGHSERRHVLGESDELINAKTKHALAAGLKVVLCVGELLADREGNRTEAVLDEQLNGGLDGVSAEDMQRVVLAYEPVWAIGTGKTAQPEQAESAHAHLRKRLADRYNDDVAQATRILYGGSVKADNAKELLSQSHVDGALVGGASLKSDQFCAIIEAAGELAKS